jgi:hypothetical protein
MEPSPFAVNAVYSGEDVVKIVKQRQISANKQKVQTVYSLVPFTSKDENAKNRLILLTFHFTAIILMAKSSKSV